jgi:hypothetical protein
MKRFEMLSTFEDDEGSEEKWKKKKWFQ